ncbi:MAG: GNAT family N-acetyltransferase [Actinobacteria bacterium]|nr:GNAT family N-acetyltransferase [Actinomycetota bacterium]
MIRLLDERDRDEVLALLDRDHELNLIMIYNITHFGLEDRGIPFQGRYFAVFREGAMSGVAALFNLGSLFIYAPEPDLAHELADHMAGLERKPRFVIGRSEWVIPLLERFSSLGLRAKGWEEQEYMTLGPESFRPRLSPEARYAVPRDLERLMELNRDFQLEYFGDLDEAEEALGRMAEVRMRDSGIAVAVMDGEIVSKAETMARTPRAALIGGVYTVPAYRGRGLSFACMSLLCKAILDNTGKACLNVAMENLPAQIIYRGIGFERVCGYRMAYFGV